MLTNTVEEAIETLNICKEVEIAAPIDISFQAVLEELGPGGQMPDGKPFPMKLEPWPGGRWYRDLGHNSGHLWGHVQVIKPPRLLEICGPMFMSYPGINHLQYRLTEEGDGTRLKLTHRALGPIAPEHLANMGEGWEYGLNRVREIAERRKDERRKETGRQRQSVPSGVTPQTPKGDTMQIQPYLFFDGRCEEAIEFYRGALGAEVTMLMHFKDNPDPGMCSPGTEDKVMHANLRIGGATVLASDGRCLGHPSFDGFSLSLTVPDEAEAERLFARLADGGKVQMPLTKTFFSPRFGMVADRFGVSWMIYVAPAGPG
jgi:PhnB protein